MGFVLYRVIVSAEFIIGGNGEKGLTFCAHRCYEGENWITAGFTIFFSNPALHIPAQILPFRKRAGLPQRRKVHPTLLFCAWLRIVLLLPIPFYVNPDRYTAAPGRLPCSPVHTTYHNKRHNLHSGPLPQDYFSFLKHFSFHRFFFKSIACLLYRQSC